MKGQDASVLLSGVSGRGLRWHAPTERTAQRNWAISLVKVAYKPTHMSQYRIIRRGGGAGQSSRPLDKVGGGSLQKNVFSPSGLSLV